MKWRQRQIERKEDRHQPEFASQGLEDVFFILPESKLRL
jgi:hypothetical protein